MSAKSVNNKMFDRFSIVHAGLGVWAGSKGFGLIPVLIGHTVWEIFEAHAKKAAPGAFYPFASPDDLSNSVGDTLAMLLGWSFSLNDVLKDDPLVGETNPLRLILAPQEGEK